jgi:hypothetical protein
LVDFEGASAEEAVTRLRERSQRIERAFVITAQLFLVLLAVGSVVLGLVVGDSIPWVWVALVILIPQIIQAIDWAWPNSVTPRYRQMVHRLAQWFGRRVTRWRLHRLLALYGSGELASRVLPIEEAEQFSVVSELRRRRRRQVVLVGGMGLALVGVLAAYLLPTGREDSRYRIGEEFSPDETFDFTVLSAPECATAGDPPRAEYLCTVFIRIENVSRERQSVGPGSFGEVTPDGAVYLRDEFVGRYQDYAIGLVKGGDYFTLEHAAFSRTSLLAGESLEASFAFEVRRDISSIDELVLAVWERPDRIHVVFANP